MINDFFYYDYNLLLINKKIVNFVVMDIVKHTATENCLMQIKRCNNAA